MKPDDPPHASIDIKAQAMPLTTFDRIELESAPILYRQRPASADHCSSKTADCSDGQLIEAVQLALFATGHAPLRDLDIEMHRGGVVMWGQVPTYYQKQLAQVAAQRVNGVRGIANGLEVICAPSL